MFSNEGATWYPPGVDQAVVRYQGSLDQAAYSRNDDFAGVKHRLMSALKRLTLPSTSAYPDVWVTPSTWTAREMERYLGVRADYICPPPIDVDAFNPRPLDEREGYYLTMSRLVDQKHVDEVIAAVEEVGARLVVAGEGPARERLEAQASDRVEFVGWVDGAEKRELLEDASGFLFAGRGEAFGIVTAEAMAAGTPVLAVASGHTQHQIPRECGIIVERGCLADAIRRYELDGIEGSAAEIHAHARALFDQTRFEQTIREAVDLACERAQLSRATLATSPASASEHQQRQSRASSDNH